MNLLNYKQVIFLFQTDKFLFMVLRA